MPNKRLIWLRVNSPPNLKLWRPRVREMESLDLIVVLIRVLRTGDRIAHTRVAADDQVRWAGGETERGLVVEPECAGRRVVQPLPEDEFVPEERRAESLQRTGREHVRFRRP